MPKSADQARTGNTQGSRVYAAIRADIIARRLVPGSPIQEEELAQRLQVSRTPVREALRRLAQEGLVRTIPNKGSLVSSISVDDVREIFQLRMALEPLATRLAAGLMPSDELRRVRQVHVPPAEFRGGVVPAYRDLHASIAAHCGNRRLCSLLDSLQDETTRILAMADAHIVQRWYNQHLVILEALEDRDGLAAEKAMQEHLLDFRRSYVFELLIGDDRDPSPVRPGPTG